MRSIHMQVYVNSYSRGVKIILKITQVIECFSQYCFVLDPLVWKPQQLTVS